MQEKNKKRKEQELKGQLGMIHNLLERYVNGTSTGKEKRVLDDIDLTQEQALWTVKEGEQLPEDRTEHVQGEVYRYMAEKEHFPQKDWRLVSCSDEVADTVNEKGIILTPSRHKIFDPYFRYATGIAAVAVILLSVFFFALPREQYYYARDKVLEIRLPDQTYIKMNKGSRLSVARDFNKATRSVQMSGEIYFEVAPDVDRPFIIEHGGLHTQVVGTSFTITDYPQLNTNSVSVSTGKVSVRQDGRELALLTPGMRLAYNKQAGAYDVAVNRSGSNEWITGKLVFYDADKAEIFFRIEQYFVMTVTDRDGVFDSSIRFNASFESGASIDDLMKRLELVAGIRYRITGNNIEIYKQINE